MFDLKLKNKCNHRIINEPLKIQQKGALYYVVLNYPATGNNGKVLLMRQEELFKPEALREYTPFHFGENKQTLVLTWLDNIADLYPQPKLYATYWTSAGTCPRCLGQDKTVNDMILNPIGKPTTITGFDFLLQKFKKALITELGANYFNENYGSTLIKTIGKPRTALSILIIQQQIMDVADFIISEQLENADFLDDSERLLKVDNFQLAPNNNPKMVNITFDIYNYAYQYRKLEMGL